MQSLFLSHFFTSEFFAGGDLTKEKVTLHEQIRCGTVFH
jgi:hypothetical protein